MVLKSTQFDDVYFSAEDGAGETRHVFLNGNNLPDAWEGKNAFTIIETGFGTGLNFIMAWELFNRTADDGASLHFISFEKFPLTVDVMMKALKSALPDNLSTHIEMLTKEYPKTLTGTHTIKISEKIILTVIFDDVNTAITSLNDHADCWFLDGFKPSTNPDMWSEILFKHMARLSHVDTTLATFTAAGFVRRGLQAAGFEIKKIPGFGRKREMIVGIYQGDQS